MIDQHAVDQQFDQIKSRPTRHMLAVMRGRSSRVGDDETSVLVRGPSADVPRFPATAECKHVSEGRWRGLPRIAQLRKARPLPRYSLLITRHSSPPVALLLALQPLLARLALH